MKKILMLGGSHFQVPAIITAKKMGLHVITCDYLPQNPGHQYADEYYNVSTTDLDGVLQLAQKLRIDGIVAYASDPAAPTAAYVAEKLGLPGNPYESVKILTNKDLYRTFLKEHGFCTPRAKGYTSYEEAKAEFDTYKMPVMVKPVDSSGSKGISRLDTPEHLKESVKLALSFSRAGRFLIEEYVEKDGYQIAGDGFTVDGKLVFRCFGNGHFSSKGINPYVPIGGSWPCVLPEYVQENIHQEIQKVFSYLHVRTGAYNFDIRIDREGNIYLMEIGARNGGNMIPQAIQCATGVDVARYAILAALGESCSDLKMCSVNGFWSSYLIHSDTAGILKGVSVDPTFKEKNLVDFKLFYHLGDLVDNFSNSSGTLGAALMKYRSKEEMLDKMAHMEKWINIFVEPEREMSVKK